MVCWPGCHPEWGHCPLAMLLAGSSVVADMGDGGERHHVISLLICPCDVFSWQVPKLSSVPAVEATVGSADGV